MENNDVTTTVAVVVCNNGRGNGKTLVQSVLDDCRSSKRRKLLDTTVAMAFYW